MNENDVLKAIAENLSERKSSAALNNYQVLCSNIRYVNELLKQGVADLRAIHALIEAKVKADECVEADFKDNTKPLFHFRSIVPRILLNDISIIDKFVVYTEPDAREGITVETVGELSKSFLDYNNLVTSARQFIDSLVSDAYQLVLLDPKSANFHVLTSLLSFNKYATKSIRHALFNKEIEDALTEFESLTYNERVRGDESAITKASDRTFGAKVDFLFNQLGPGTQTDFKDEIKNLFSFASEFTHIGYVSTFFTTSNSAEVIFGDEVSPYLPSTENFSELKYELLDTATRFFTDIYLPILINATARIFEPATAQSLEEMILGSQSNIANGLKTRNNQYYFFIRQGLIGSNETIDLTCMCRVTNNWQPPHDASNIYCKNCGSQFNLIELEGDPGYIITGSGPVKVIGSTAPDFDKLPPEKQAEMLKQVEDLRIKAATQPSS